MPRSKPWTVTVEGGEDLERKLVLAGKRVAEVLPKAAKAGSDRIKTNAIAAAPGPHVIVEPAKPWNAKEVSFEIGPDKDHWFYRFFEYGVQNFEINMISKRTKRSGINRKKSRIVTSGSIEIVQRTRRVRVGDAEGTETYWDFNIPKTKLSKRGGRAIGSALRAVKFGANQIYSAISRGPMAARPFMRKAVRQHNDSIAKEVGDEFKRVLDELLK